MWDRAPEHERAEARLRELLRFEPPPNIPKSRPHNGEQRHEIVREIANWLLKHRGREVTGEPWILEFEPMIQSYLDPPRTLQELQRGALDRRPGYDTHHIAEKASAYRDGFTSADVENPQNLVLIPRLRHWQITSWYMTPNTAFRNFSPREYLRGKELMERTEGLRALILHGVLKP
jgi:hypothetical protein